MTHYDKRWLFRIRDKENSRKLAQEAGVSEVLAELLTARGIDTALKAEAFLNPSLEMLLDPFSMKGMDHAVARIQSAMKNKDSICIYGDYDVDGITAISLLCRFFKWLNYPVDYYIPDRLEDGYGINSEGLKRLKEQGFKLIISVDCGITATVQAELAKEIGLDLIITDHHEPQETLPDAIAVVNPKRRDCTYLEKTLSGVGVALKLAQGICPDVLNSEIAPVLLQIAALGTVADIVPMLGENRILVSHGLKAIYTAPIPGIQELIRTAGLAGSRIRTGQIGFMLAPRINAAGRIDMPQKGVELLLSDNLEACREIADELSSLNDERQRIERSIFEEALAQLEQDPELNDRMFLVASDPEWHPGVVGIVASRIVEKYYRPCILLHQEGNILKGSARSIEGFNLFEALESCSHLLMKFGGHEMAAGLTFDCENLNALKVELNKIAQERIAERDKSPRIRLDMALEPRHLHFDILDDLDAMEPFGPGNSRPVFLYRGLTVDQKRLLGKNQEHVKLTMHDGNRVYEAIGFRWPHPERFQPGKRIDLAFALDRNVFNGVESLQMQIRDGRLRDWQAYSNKPDFNPFWDSCWDSYSDFCGVQPEPEGFMQLEIPTDAQEEVFGSDTLTLIWSPEAFESVLGNLHDGTEEELPAIHYNRAEPSGRGDILINPIPNAEMLEKWDRITVWGHWPTERHRQWFLRHCKNPLIRYNDTVASAIPSILRSAIPSKDALADTYRRIRKGVASPEETVVSVEGDMRMQVNVHYWILEKNGLIQRSAVGDQIRYTLSDYQGQRMNILDSVSYQSLIELRRLAEQIAEHEKNASGGTP